MAHPIRGTRRQALSPAITDPHFVSPRFRQLRFPGNRVVARVLVVVGQVVLPDMVGAPRRLAPGPGQFRRRVIDRNSRSLLRPNPWSRVKASFIEGILVIHFKTIQREGTSRPAQIPLASPQPPLFAGVVAFRLGLGFLRGELERTTQSRLRHIQVGIDLDVGDIERAPHFRKSMNLPVQGQVTRHFERRIVQQVAQHILVFEAVHPPRNGTPLPNVGGLL